MIKCISSQEWCKVSWKDWTQTWIKLLRRFVELFPFISLLPVVWLANSSNISSPKSLSFYYSDSISFIHWDQCSQLGLHVPTYGLKTTGRKKASSTCVLSLSPVSVPFIGCIYKTKVSYSSIFGKCCTVYYILGIYKK